MDRETLSHYGWIVILTLILAVLLALASPFGNFIADAIRATAAGFFETSDGAFDIDYDAYWSEDENGPEEETENINLDGGWYDANDVLLASWTDLVEKYGMGTGDFTNSNGGDPTQLACIVKNNPELQTGIKLVVPEGVTKVGNFAYCRFPELQVVVMPKSCTTIGSHAFFDSNNLRKVIIQDGLETIELYAFWYCTSIININLPESVKHIEEHAFSACVSLQKIKMPSTIEYIGDSVFSWCSSLRTVGPAGSGADVEIPNGITSMGEDAFALCYGIVEAKIPDNITTIEKGMFRECYGLTSLGPTGSGCAVELPNTITSIGNYAFQYAGFTSIKLPDSVQSVGERAFDMNEFLKTVDLGNGITTISGSAFYFSLRVETIKMPVTISSIGSYSITCEALRTINYGGTMAQWELVSKASNWDAATEGYAVVCTDGTICKQHLGGTATCQKLANCKFCGEEYGSLASCDFKTNKDTVYTYYSSSYHRYVPNCTVCGKEPGPNSTYSASHSGGTATCTEKAICEYCNHEYGSTLEHNNVVNEGAQWEYYNDNSHAIAATCSICNSSSQIIEEHRGGTPTCQGQATCSTCNSKYGFVGTHVPVDGFCSLCGVEATVIETTHYPIPKNVNRKVIGTWDYSDAKSVNITVRYQIPTSYYTYASIIGGIIGDGTSRDDTYRYLRTDNGTVQETTGVYTYVMFSNYAWSGASMTVKTFENVDMLTGSVIFYASYSTTLTDVFGVQVTVTPNY